MIKQALLQHTNNDEVYTPVYAILPLLNHDLIFERIEEK